MQQWYRVIQWMGIVAVLGWTIAAAQVQGLVNNGVICNQGVIKVKGVLQSGGQGSGKEEGIDNEKGVLVVEGNAFVQQDSLLGRVEFVRDRDGFIQVIPAITYASVYFAGISRKIIDTSYHRALVALDTFVTRSQTQLELKPTYPIITLGRVRHNGWINPARLFGRVILRGDRWQQVDGKGIFREVELNNPQGAEVVNGGGFRITTILDLKRGIFQNTADSNFVLADGAWIRRTPDAQLAYTPIFSGKVSIEYYGSGALTTGPEIPHSDTVLQQLRIRTTGPVTADRSFTVNDTLWLENSLIMEPDPQLRFTLTYTPLFDPVFANRNAEIEGTLYRTSLKTGRLNRFNNWYTYVVFPTEEDRGAVRRMSVRVKPQTPPFPDQNPKMVERAFELHAYDEAGDELDTGFALTLGYGWRVVPYDETQGLPVQDIVLQWWDGEQWKVIGESDTARVDTPWAYGRARNVTALGYLALGPRGEVERIVVNMRVFLEGPYQGGGQMRLWLHQLGMLPRTPPNIYPYNLDPQRPFIRVDEIPDSVVDWIVVELRTLESGGKRLFHTGFLRYDGTIVELDGKTPMRLEAGNYYIIVRHRNHLAVMTKQKVQIQPGVASIVDLTRAQFLYGGSNAAKVVDVGAGGYVYALMGGDVNGDGTVDRADYDGSPQSSWEQRNQEGYIEADSNLDGIVTTKDVNLNWNNRGRRSLVP